jgi:hypothetical protein
LDFHAHPAELGKEGTVSMRGTDPGTAYLIFLPEASQPDTKRLMLRNNKDKRK